MEDIEFDKTQKMCRLCLSAESKLIEILNNRDIEVVRIHILIEKMCHIQVKIQNIENLQFLIFYKNLYFYWLNIFI